MGVSLAWDLQRLEAGQRAGLAQQERRRRLGMPTREQTAACPVCGRLLEAEDQLAYTLRGAARDTCLGCEACLGPLLPEQMPEGLRCTAWEAEELWH